MTNNQLLLFSSVRVTAENSFFSIYTYKKWFWNICTFSTISDSVPRSHLLLRRTVRQPATPRRPSPQTPPRTRWCCPPARSRSPCRPRRLSPGPHRCRSRRSSYTPWSSWCHAARLRAWWEKRNGWNQKLRQDLCLTEMETTKMRAFLPLIRPWPWENSLWFLTLTSSIQSLFYWRLLQRETLVLPIHQSHKGPGLGQVTLLLCESSSHTVSGTDFHQGINLIIISCFQWCSLVFRQRSSMAQTNNHRTH